MATNRPTATAAPAPGDNGKPKNGPVRIAQVEPDLLNDVDLGLPAALLPPELAAMLETATQAEAAARVKRAKVAAPRVALTVEQAAALAHVGWKAPAVTAELIIKPQPRGRANACAAGPVYRVLGAMLPTRPVHVAELAALWAAAGQKPRPAAAIMQQVANRLNRAICQDGALFALI